MTNKICGFLLFSAGVIAMSIATANENVFGCITGAAWMICGAIQMKEVTK